MNTLEELFTQFIKGIAAKNIASGALSTDQLALMRVAFFAGIYKYIKLNDELFANDTINDDAAGAILAGWDEECTLELNKLSGRSHEQIVTTMFGDDITTAKLN